MPLVTRDPYKQVSQGKEMPGCHSIPSLGTGTRGRKIKIVSHPWRVNPYPFFMTPDLFCQGTEVRAWSSPVPWALSLLYRKSSAQVFQVERND